MGIKGLSQVLEPWCSKTHVDKYANARAAVDAYSWMHKGIYSCASDIACGNLWWRTKGQDAPYVTYCLFRANLLRHNGITPVIVFDGDRLPAKRREEEERRARRLAQISRGHEAKSVNDSDGARNAFAAGMDVTPAMAHELIVALRKHGFEFIVAPYEADGQIAALASTPTSEGGVDLVFTEDSDLVAYGCEKVIFKLEKSGDAREFQLRKMFAGPPTQQHTENDENVSKEETEQKKGPPPLNFQGWDFEMFLSLCVLSGCDFLDNIRGLGIKKMYALMNKCRDANAAFKLLRTDKKIDIPENYESDFWRARLIFKHALVYDSQTKSLRHLTPIPDDTGFEDLSFLGPKFDDAEAASIAAGETDPITRKKFIATAPTVAAASAGDKGRGTSSKDIKLGGKRKLDKALGPAATSAQKSLMMTFFSKVAKVVTSPMKSSSAPLPNERPKLAVVAVSKPETLELLDDDDFDFNLQNSTADAAKPPIATTNSEAEILEIDALDFTPRKRAKANIQPPVNAFARTSPRKTNSLASLFSPARRSKERVSANLASPAKK